MLVQRTRVLAHAANFGRQQAAGRGALSSVSDDQSTHTSIEGDKLPPVLTAVGFILMCAGADGLHYDTVGRNSPLPTVLLEVTIAELSAAERDQ